jgi:hypothetical protein
MTTGTNLPASVAFPALLSFGTGRILFPRGLGFKSRNQIFYRSEPFKGHTPDMQPIESRGVGGDNFTIGETTLSE